ncbi:MAG: winged helix-turn-helix domain-containing protein [Acidobacteriota bacterium]
MNPESHSIAFGPFSLDLASDCLRRDGGPISLRPQAFRALKALVSHSGRHLDHEQMIRQAWDGVLVSKHTVTVTIGEVKRILGEYGAWISCHPRLGYCLEVPESEDLLRTGWHFLNRRTREDLEKALACFERAAEETGAETRALEGIAHAYLLLGVYAIRAPRDSYPHFLAAHRKVVERHGYTPALRVDRALGLHSFEFRFEEAEAQLLLAQEAQPRFAEVYVRLAMLYVSWNRMDQALDMLAQARAADVLGPPLAMAEILVHFCRREFELAAECGRKVLELHPYLQTVLTFHANALEFCGLFELALDQYRKASALAPDLPWHRAMEGACLARMGRMREAAEMLALLRRKQRTEYVDGYHLSLLLEAMGRREEAFVELMRAEKDDCPTLSMLAVDPKMDNLRLDPRFSELQKRLFQKHHLLSEPASAA